MTGGDDIGADDIASVKYQRIKLIHGADGVNDGDVSSVNGLPVSLLTGTNAIGKLGANSGVDIGDVDVLSLPADPLGANADAVVTPGGAGSISGKLRQMSSDLDAVKTSVEILDNIVSGSEAQVDVVAPLPAGTNAIGKLGANSGVDIGDVDVLSQPARDRTTDNQGVALQTDAIMNDTTVLTPKYVPVNVSSSGNNTLISAVVGKKIRVLTGVLIAGGDVLARFEDGAGGGALSGQMDLTANSGFAPPFSPVGHFETTANTLLNLELDGAVSADGWLVYVEV